MNVLRFVQKISTPARVDEVRGVVFAAAGHHAPSELPLDAARANLDRLGAGIQREVDVLLAAKDRLPAPPPKVRAPTLQDLVQQGRHKLLHDRQGARSAQLEQIQQTVDHLKASLKDAKAVEK